jgi:hypothetical protein
MRAHLCRSAVLPILRHAIEASPGYRLVDVRDVLGG